MNTSWHVSFAAASVKIFFCSQWVYSVEIAAKQVDIQGRCMLGTEVESGRHA